MAKVLIIGSGGREHALAYKFKQSPQVTQVFVAPGNPGIAEIATCVNISIHDFTALVTFAQQQQIDLTVVGPEEPLVNGIVDIFQQHQLPIFGPNKQAAALEGSKRFAKDLMKKYNIPTAAYQTFTDFHDAKVYVANQMYPLVIKASGLAAGKGVVIAENYQHAVATLEAMMVHHQFNSAADEVVIEEFLQGEEFSLLCLVDQDIIVPLEIAQDHKKAYDHDQGPNTGGMGAYLPVASITNEIKQQAMTQVVEKTIQALKQEGITFQGVLYAGLMQTENGVKVIEFNVRFGDPETEVLMLALNSDLYDTIMSLKNHQQPQLLWSSLATIGAVLAAKGYPATHVCDVEIKNLKAVEATVFHIGTKLKDGKLLSAGGRVLFVACQAETLAQAQQHLYQEIAKIDCDQLFYRRDIGFHNLKEEV